MTRSVLALLAGALLGATFADGTYPVRQSVACEPQQRAPSKPQERRRALALPIPYDATATHSGTPGVVPRTYFYVRSR